MWLTFAIGAFLSLLGIIGLYVSEYWDEFCYKGQHRGEFQYWKGENEDTIKFVGIATPSQIGL